MSCSWHDTVEYLLELQWVPSLINNTVVFKLTLFSLISCFQLEPDTERYRLLTVPDEWKIVDGILQQVEEGTPETGTAVLTQVM